MDPSRLIQVAIRQSSTPDNERPATRTPRVRCSWGLHGPGSSRHDPQTGWELLLHAESGAGSPMRRGTGLAEMVRAARTETTSFPGRLASGGLETASEKHRAIGRSSPGSSDAWDAVAGRTPVARSAELKIPHFAPDTKGTCTSAGRMEAGPQDRRPHAMPDRGPTHVPDSAGTAVR